MLIKLNNDTLISDMGLSTRAYHSLRAAGIDTLSKLVALGRAKTLQLENLGHVSLAEIESVLTNIDLDLVWDWYRVDEMNRLERKA